MFFRELIFAASLMAATPMTAQIIEDISMLTLPGSNESEAPAQVLIVLPVLDPSSLVIVTWNDGTTSAVPTNQVMAWYEAPTEE